MRRRAGALAIAAALGLSACGGGSGDDSGGSNGGTTPPPPPPPASVTFSELTTSFDTLFATATGGSSDIVALPSSGTASFEGAAVFGDITRDQADIQANPSLASRVELNLDFNTTAVTGRLFDFRSSTPGATTSGQIDMSNGAFVNGPPPGYQARLAGSVTENGTTSTYGGQFSGLQGFLTTSGTTFGVITLDEGSDGLNDTKDLKGNFAAN